MARKYTLKLRAEQQAQTRHRIVEAAIDLHARLGPAATTFSMVAEQAGVQRNTLYAHFPDEWSLLLACSGLHLERDPLPDADPWRAIDDRHERLRTSIAAIYGWYERNAALAASVLRDAEHHEATRKIAQLRMAPAIAAWHEVLGAELALPQRATLAVAVSFYTWRTLTRDAGLTSEAAAASMLGAVESAMTSKRPRRTAQESTSDL